jgi:transcriptional regulator with XRE-family HTH domain
MGAKKPGTKKPQTKASPRQRKIQVWRKEVLQAARAALEYTIKDIEEKSGVDYKVVSWIMRGQYNVQYESLEAVVSSLFLKMFEIYNPEAKISTIIEEIYDRANLKHKVREVNGGVVAVKTDSTLIAIPGK